MSRHTPGESEFEKNQPSGEQLKEDAKQAVRKVKHRVKESASQAAGEVKEQARTAVRQQQEMAAEKLSSVAQAVRDSAERLREDEEAPSIAGLIEQAADRIESFSTYLREQDLRDMIDNVQNWARRNPTIFLGGSFILGLVVARLLKSTREAYEREDFTEDYNKPAYRPRDVGQSRFSEQAGSSSSGQYGESAFSPTQGQRMTEPGSTERWEEP